ncbi:MAG: hypothetical protein COV74_03200 [Candidatus Omnitrophica bacterium CG11_big_fil_rev_8_21_14_0_20_45_26]|uniref:Uncharacterized protein n=1 Tax=Candidatus Abzuiibacterium crystallinum TaxID=1974748 RepID=A0A2H0LR12_9BACT|nr:MAG: hypothetical protein COV74_03200 [Candidatus Omnitrophica bacterium CG11_big_fil_rev_8_21_14_0_20_45_26]PIW64682.1 MAG: hypothetical protein COW12_05225 [Candidatus Omnitrophica bacterium CG12_big_fil_rev_8_21_14_0_65_45_16]
MQKTVLITTTIRVPTFLEAICRNSIRYGHEDIAFLIIGDLKTPAAAGPFCEKLSKQYKRDVRYLNIEQQNKALADYPRLKELMPVNHAARKMIGNFLAYLGGCERVVMIDDDNFITEEDFIGAYEMVGRQIEMDVIQTETGWFNVYEAVQEANGIPFYPRGFPWSKRLYQKEVFSRQKNKVTVAAKQGIVLEDTDVDAVTRLFWPLRVVGMKKDFEPQFALDPTTWSSFNNQNTALSRAAIPVYFTPPTTGRNADIWTAFILCRLTEQMREVIAYGHPLVRQVRNPHNLWKDLEDEWKNNRATDPFVDLLRSVDLKEATYLGALEELLKKSLEKLPTVKNMADQDRQLIHDFLTEYQIWQSLFSEIPTV